MDAHTLKVLEFNSIIAMLRERTACALGDEFARELEPSVDLFTIKEAQSETSEADKIIREDGNLPLGGIHDIRMQVTKSSLDAKLEPSELISIAETLLSGRRLRAFILKRAEKCPRLTRIATNIGQFQRLEDEINNAVSENGEIRSTASPELARVRSKLKTTHSRLVERLHSIIGSAEFRTIVQDPVVTQRGDRYCIPVKSEHRSQFPGIVHDSSASGATVFVEPASVVDMGNDLKELALKEQQEVEKILRRLTGMVRAASSEILITLDSLGRLDFACAKARLSGDMDASEPELNRDGRVDVRRARHPLLKGDVVPINIELGTRFKALLITGPNTGGKTVTLKTIGLVTLMAQSGLHIPALPGGEVAVFDQIYADIGDEQSIQQSLSTFSSHLTNIVKILDRAGRNSLVLLDEVGAGTDPAEGAALAQAIVDTLVDSDARTVATTHYAELKEYAFVREGVENASVEFDVQTLKPTYRLMIGVPGSSNAFAIASRLGLPDEVIHRAQDAMRGGSTSEDVLRKIEESHRVASEREQVAERASKDVETLKSLYEDQLDEIEALRREMRQQLATEIERRVRERMDDIDEIVQSLKKDSGDQKKFQQGRERFSRRVKEIRREVEEILPDLPVEKVESGVPKAGDRVKVTSFGVEGELLNNPGDGEAVVMAGSLKITVPFDQVRLVFRPKAGKKSRKQEGPSESVRIASSKAVNISPELKLIAQRAEQALMNLDKYMDDAYLAGISSVRIIHGKGTGALRMAVWDFLKNHYAVKSYRLGDADEGGAGATVVEFKDR